LDTAVDYEESELRYSECNDENDKAAESGVQCVPVDFHVVFFGVFRCGGICGFDVIGSWSPSTGFRMTCWACWACWTLGDGYTAPVF